METKPLNFSFDGVKYNLNLVKAKIGDDGIRKLYDENNKVIEGLRLNHLVDGLETMMDGKIPGKEINISHLKEIIKRIKVIETETESGSQSSLLHRIRSGVSSFFYDRKVRLSNIENKITELDISSTKITDLPVDMLNEIMSYMNPQEMKNLGQAAKPFKSIVDDKWKVQAKQLGISEPLEGKSFQATVQEYVSKIKNDARKDCNNSSYYMPWFEATFKDEVKKLIESDKIEDISNLAKYCKARDALILRIKLQDFVKREDQKIDFNTIKFNSLKEFIDCADKFPLWCKENQEDLKQVESLVLSGLNSLPKEIGYLSELKKLYFDECRLTSLPESFGELANLEELTINNNKLTSLPESFGKLVKLSSLGLGNNQLTSLPKSFGKLVNLSSLGLANNQLTSLPESFGKLVKLTELYLANNQLNSLPESFEKLIDLNSLSLADNKLTSLPESFEKLVNLNYLNLAGNQLTSLPESFGKLVNLTKLYLANNQLTSLPESFGKLKNLYRLDLADNKLTFLPNNLLFIIELKYGNQLT